MASDAQVLHQLLLALSVGLPWSLETILWRRSPHRLARLAYVPLATVAIPVGPRVRAMLTPLATYRESGQRHLTLAAWPGVRQLAVIAAHQAQLDAEGGRNALPRALAPRWFCFGGVVGGALTLTTQGTAIAIRLRGYPWLTAPALGGFGFLIALATIDGEWAIAATLTTVYLSFQAVAFARCRQGWRRDAVALADAFAREVARLEGRGA